MANEPPPAQLEASYAHVKRFAAGSDESLAFLDENGFVLLPTHSPHPRLSMRSVSRGTTSKVSTLA